MKGLFKPPQNTPLVVLLPILYFLIFSLFIVSILVLLDIINTQYLKANLSMLLMIFSMIFCSYFIE